MRVAIVGGTGFVGSYLIDELILAGHQPVVLVRPGSENNVRQAQQCELISGDIGAPETLTRLLKDSSAVIYNVGILRERPRQGITFEKIQYEGAKATVDAAHSNNVSRLLLMSANGSKVPGTPYQETKKRAEDYALASGLDVTVFRPSVVFGDPRGRSEIATQLYEDMIRPPLPAINFYTGWRPGSGAIRMSPVHVEDIATAFIHALSDDTTIGQVYTLGGPEKLTWREILKRIAMATGNKKLIVPMPVKLMWVAALLFDRLSFFPVTRDQLTMLAEGNTADSVELEKLIHRRPRYMTREALEYLRI